MKLISDRTLERVRNETIQKTLAYLKSMRIICDAMENKPKTD